MFRVQGGTTPYEKCSGVQYHGRLVRFGEIVMCALSTKHVRKGKPKFVKDIWLGKTLNGDLHICGTSVGVYLSSCIRRNLCLGLALTLRRSITGVSETGQLAVPMIAVRCRSCHWVPDIARCCTQCHRILTCKARLSMCDAVRGLAAACLWLLSCGRA